MTSLDKLTKQFDAIGQIDLKSGVGEGIAFVQAEAEYRCPVGDGELRESINTKVEEQNEAVTGTCFTTKEYAPYVELGAGPIGQADHAGISPEVSPVYTQEPWWIHESQIDAATAERYNFFHIDTKQGRFYRTAGQAAQPFMYPALADNRDEVTKIIAEATKKQIRSI